MNYAAIETEIISICRQRLEKYEVLLSLSTEQQSILTDCRHSDLAENLSRFDPILADIERLDKRENALNTELDSPSGEFIRERDALIESTSDMAKQLKSSVWMNAELLTNAKSFVDFSIKLISSLASCGQQSANAASGSSVMLDQMV